ncbi:MAG: N-acetylmuramoyl-L-alanine amidase [Deltaproteobacteria bacterium]|nr:N-acetylmuramoyl-L-alanine amidase [Deltaproteobacteria bacterium]MBW2123290.1 N-acetylmuramoyl-L-alanine amidase [Deltaproteobacteria bacterium]
MRYGRPLLAFALVLLMSSWWACRATASPPKDGETAYKEARAEYYALRNSEAKRRYRSNWVRCIGRFEAVWRDFPESQRADDALYMVGRLYEDLHRRSGRASDLEFAISAYQRLTALYPSSRLADDGQFRIGMVYLKLRKYEEAYISLSKVERRFPNGDMTKAARKQLVRLRPYRPKKRPLVQVKGIRHWSSPEYTRVVIDLERDAEFEVHLLKEDRKRGEPPRLYVDIQSSWISADLSRPIPIRDGLLTMARVAQHTRDVVRVVLDMESLASYKAFPLKVPSRIIVDVHGDRGSSLSPGADHGVVKRRSFSPQPDLGIRRVVIDPGHGGKDPGAIGPGGLQEKDVVLKIAKKLEKRLRRELGLETILTRNGDTFVSLDERTAIANTHNADLFVSIHANANRRQSARGIETYVLNFATDEESIELAARENAVSRKKLSDLQYILYDLMRTAKIGESRTLAEYTQESICRHLSGKYHGIRNLGVKEAPFYVLIGANMPCILVEVSFISNRQEERRLGNDRYLDEIAKGIEEGIARYIAESKRIPTT